ncbi:MAG: tRNA 2-thiouridine(34) synthase MnmA [Clostridia bacterium]|nr:tRNA 2-thiouridine(34) synthase MnmA [Clostridia bacterium]
MNNKAFIAMSGGVDSGVAAFLTKQNGYDCIGGTMKLVIKEKPCFSESDIEDARSLAKRLQIEHYVFDLSDRFCNTVIAKFISEYENGRTPNPCVYCNRHIKFDSLYQKAKELDCDHIVTGHYARIERDLNGRFLLKKAVDTNKDQSYVLFSLTQEQLSHILLPLGEMSKPDVRKIAEDNGFVNAHKKDSQDICFIENGKYGDFIENYTGTKFPEGDFVTQSGKVLGRHKGIIRYTVGQRKGLGLALDHPMYVVRLDMENNNVVLGENEDLFTTSVDAENINLISVPEMYTPMRVKAKVRYRQAEQWATALQTGDNTLHIEFDEPQRAITKGQAVVMYDGDTVVGGGIIK